MSEGGLTPEQVLEHKHAMAGLAEMFRSYFLSLREQGFSRREAMQMTLEYQREIVRGSSDD